MTVAYIILTIAFIISIPLGIMCFKYIKNSWERKQVRIQTQRNELKRKNAEELRSQYPLTPEEIYYDPSRSDVPTVNLSTLEDFDKLKFSSENKDIVEQLKNIEPEKVTEFVNHIFSESEAAPCMLSEIVYGYSKEEVEKRAKVLSLVEAIAAKKKQEINKKLNEALNEDDKNYFSGLIFSNGKIKPKTSK